MNLNDPVDLATIAVITIAAAGIVGGVAFALLRRTRPGPARAGRPPVRPRPVLARATSYGGLAVLVIVAARVGVPGIAALVLLLGLFGIVEWARLFDLPIHHLVSMLVSLPRSWQVASLRVAPHRDSLGPNPCRGRGLRLYRT